MSFTQKLVKTITHTSFADSAVTVVGCGYMGKEYVKALRTLGIGSIQVCARTKKSLEVKSFTGGYVEFDEKPKGGEWAILAIPIEELIPAAYHFVELGFKKFLIEKPVSLYSKEIKTLLETCQKNGVEVFCAYNRVAYPSLLEARYWAEKEGGFTSCFYTMTEIIGKDWEKSYSRAELARWGIANSLHVASMAHGLIGMPKRWKGFQSGDSLSWHPTGSIFVGSGVSKKGIPFAYHADWGSTGRWSVELHTRKASYLLCPLEKLFRRTSFKEPWQEIPVHPFDEKIKAGIVEEVAAFLRPELRPLIPLFSLEEAYTLTQFGEQVFGYVA